MLKLSQKDIKQGYAGIKHLAKKAMRQGNYDLAMSYIQHCATIAQQFNWIYADFELDDILKEIADINLGKMTFQPIEKKAVFFDDFCRSYVLAIQYLEALINDGYQILYISTKLKDKVGHGLIYDKLATYSNIIVYPIDASNPIYAMKQIQKQIVSFAPSKIILHCYAFSLIVPVLYSLPKEVKSYIINLADQTFWLGAKAVDYVLEFRQFGVSVSQQRRGIKPEQQLLVPFYPMVDNNPFQGFPLECTKKGKVLIFSGGDIYKVLDDRMMYWHLVKKILDTYPQVVFLFATKGDGIGMQIIGDFIKRNHYEGRFIYTKFRPDINEVMAHVDIFMGTCPVCGSLMSQLAARNSKPILQYYYPNTPDDETEQAICYNDQFHISYDDEDAFMQEADRLIKDSAYCKKQGERLQKAMISTNQFNQLVKDTLSTNVTQVPLRPFSMDYRTLDNRWFTLEKQGYISSIEFFYSILGAKNCFINVTQLWIKKNVNKIMKYLTKE